MSMQNRSSLFFRTSLISALLVAFMGSGLGPAIASDGHINTTFSSDGYVDFENAFAPAGTSSYGVATDSQNRVITAGVIESFNGSSEKAFVSRYLPSGELDNSFSLDLDGKVSFADSSYFNGVAIDSTDRIIAAGEIRRYDGDGYNVSAGQIFRFTSAGELDPTFGVDGELSLPGESVRKILIDPSQKILVLRYERISSKTYLSRYSANGDVDISFGLGDEHRVEVPQVGGTDASYSEIALDTSGRIVIGGTIQPVIQGIDPEEFAAVVRYSPNGQLDTTFGAPNGYIKVVPETQGLTVARARMTSVTVQSSGRIVIAGESYHVHIGNPEPYGSVAFIAGFTSSGAVDDTFGNLGVTILGSATSTTESRRTHATVMNSLEQLTIFSRGNAANSGAGTRLTRDGNLDPTFGNSGEFTWSPGNIPIPRWYGQSAAISKSGILYFTGTLVPGEDIYNGFIASFKGYVPAPNEDLVPAPNEDLVPAPNVPKAEVAYVTKLKITGTAKTGKTLKASNGTWTSSLAITYSYQWYSCTKKSKKSSLLIPSNCKAIPSATGSKYKITKKSKNAKKYIRVNVTATNGETTKSVLSPSTAKVRK
jgi:uncharacterized delta-60 repeat protein